METFVLILSMYAGMFADGDSVALTNVPGFNSKVECEEAGVAAQHLAAGTKKDVTFVCVKQTFN